MRGRALSPIERTLGWMVGLPFASWRYLARDIEVRREETSCRWPIERFPEDECRHPGDPGTLRRPSTGCGAAFRRRYRVHVRRPVLNAAELMAVVLNDPNVACPLELARFERGEDRSGPIDLGEQMRVRLPGPWNGPVRVVHVNERSFRLATLRGHMEAGEIEFRGRDTRDGLIFEIESWARSGGRIFDFLYDRLGIARELQLDMWAFFLERVAQLSGGAAEHGIDIYTERCDDHPL
jgi:hypothetical protein